MVIAGIDYSLTSPGICVFDNSKNQFLYKNTQCYFRSNLRRFEQYDNGNLHGENHSTWNTEEDRYDDIANWALTVILRKNSVDKVFLEGYSYGSTGRVFHIAENTGILKYNMWDNEIPFDIIPPTVIKKFATGKGNANKEKMYEAFCNENPTVNLRNDLTSRSSNVISPVSDIVDAYFIAKYGYENAK